MANEFENYNSDEIFKKIYEIYEKMDDTGYVENPLQMAKFVNVVKVFEILAKEHNAKLEVPELRPKDRHGSVVITFDYFLADDKLYNAFRQAIDVADYLEISPMLDGRASMCISVPNVFVYQGETHEDS